jgi:hypothetical protein
MNNRLGAPMRSVRPAFDIVFCADYKPFAIRRLRGVPMEVQPYVH